MRVVVTLTLVLVALVCRSHSESDKRQLSPESQNLIGMFRTYLSTVERKQRDEHSVVTRDLGRDKRTTSSLLCTERGDCGKIIHNFALVLDPKAGARMCKAGSNPKKLFIQSDYDTSPYCQYLQSQFDVCSNNTNVMNIGCKFTCKKCLECDDDECKCSKHATGKYVDGRYICKCKEGYRGDGFHCVNINECVEDTHDCDRARGICKDLDPFWQCTCKNGYSGDGKNCTDVDECATGTHFCDENAQCKNTIGSYTCHCNKHYEGNGRYCKPIDYCGTGRDECDANSRCITKAVYYECKCNIGYKDNDEPPTGRSCSDYDECANNNHSCNAKHGICNNTIGSYTCRCKTGFEGDGIHCHWINPCKRGGHSCHQKANCLANTRSYKYTCKCMTGYKSTSSEEGRTCEDIDECKEGTAECDPNSKCNNTVGSYKCICNAGYRMEGSTCVDIDECAEYTDKCKGNSRCNNTVGSYVCTCPTGFELGNDELSCNDINECVIKTHKCDSNATCNNTVGSYTCKCNEGYEGTGWTCKDIDECARGTSKCDRYATCTNTPGSCFCKCNKGFESTSEPEGEKCEDINECTKKTHKCHVNGHCNNTVGSYKCTCNTGYRGSGRDCADINECEEHTFKCDRRADCNNTQGSYTCKCKKGFESSSRVAGKVCQDINECSRGTDNCHSQHGNCKNTIGSFSCSCKKGFKGNGVTCSDINECETGSHECHTKAECHNTIGSYKCRCNKGFQTDGDPEGYKCLNIDECTLKTHNCSKDATCTDTDGSYKCKCKPGYEGNGKTCNDINECEVGTHACSKHASCNNTEGSYICTCKTGFTGNGRSCLDINECDTGAHKCHTTRAVCTNTVGSYRCECKVGYTGDGISCSNINECSSNPCHAHADCTDTEGSYICRCKVGFKPATSSRRSTESQLVCEDVDECKNASNSCSKNAWCDNTIGSYICKCKDGYQGDGKVCTDINECASAKHNCSKYATCTNKQPFFECKCKFGFFGDGTVCTGSRGKKFMLMFMKNIDEYPHKPTYNRTSQISIVSDEDGTVKINAMNNTKVTLALQAGKRTIYTFTHDIRAVYNLVESKGVSIESDKIITVVALNHDGETSDSSLILPIDRLGTKYIVPTTEPTRNDDNDYRSQIAVVATEDLTKVNFFVKSSNVEAFKIQNTEKVGGSYQIYLNKSQTFQISHAYDLTGTRIEANNEIGVFSGNTCNQYSPVGYCSHLIEMVPPTISLDTIYIVPPNNKAGNLVRVLATMADTTVSTLRVKSGSPKSASKVLGSSEYEDFKVEATESTVVKADKPVLVMTFSMTRRSTGEPYITMVPGIHQYVPGYRVPVPNLFNDNRVAIMIKKDAVDGIQLNDKEGVSALHTSTTKVDGQDYALLEYQVKPGPNKISHKSGVRFGLLVHGEDEYDGYGYPGNMLVKGTI